MRKNASILAYWAVPFEHKGGGIITEMNHCMDGFVTWGHTYKRDPTASCPQAKNPQLLKRRDKVQFSIPSKHQKCAQNSNFSSS